jgi:hypothetical protein
MGMLQVVGLFVLVGTAAIFLGALANRVVAGLHTTQDFALAFSYLVAVVAVGAMFLDLYDLWVRGRRYAKATTRGIRMVVLVAVLGSMATGVLGRNISLIVLLFPSILIYYMTLRPQPAAAASGTTRGAARAAGGRAAAGRAAAGGKGRQRRGGKKRR